MGGDTSAPPGVEPPFSSASSQTVICILRRAEKAANRAHCGREPRALHPPGRQVTTWVPGCTGTPGTRLHLIFKVSLRHISSSIAINSGLISYEINSVPPPSSSSLLGKCPLERQKAELSLLHTDA